MPWTLDTFHALYELRHENDMPDYAMRVPRGDRKAATKEAALALFPRGTKVVREHRDALNTASQVRVGIRHRIPGPVLACAL